MALNEMHRAYASTEVRELLESRRKAEHDEATRLARAHREGKREVARQMLAAGIDRKTILQLTGLTDNDF